MRGKLAKTIRRMAEKMVSEDNLRPKKYIRNENTKVIRIFPKCERGLYLALKRNFLSAKR